MPQDVLAAIWVPSLAFDVLFMTRCHPIFALLTLFLCALDAHSAPQSRPTESKIGALLTLSGAFAAAGEDSRRGIEAAIASQGGAPALQFVYADSRNEPAVAIAEYQRLLNIAGVVGMYTHRSSIGMALNPLSLRDGLPLLGAVGHQDFATSNQFAIQIWPRADEEGSFLAKQLVARKFERVAVLFTEDEWTSSVTEGFRRTLAEAGVQPFFDQAVLPGEQDFRSQLVRIRSGVPQAVYCNVLLPQIAPLLKQARDLRVSGELFTNFYLAKREVLDVAGSAVIEGVGFVELDNDLPRLQRLLGRDESPPGLTVAAYVSTLLLSQSIDTAPKPVTREALYKSLTQQRFVQTLDRTYPVNEGRVQFPLTIKTMKDGIPVSQPVR